MPDLGTPTPPHGPIRAGLLVLDQSFFMVLGYFVGGFFVGPVLEHGCQPLRDPRPASLEEGLAEIDLQDTETHLAALPSEATVEKRRLQDRDRYTVIVVHPDYLAVHEVGPGIEHEGHVYPDARWYTPLSGGAVLEEDQMGQLIEPLFAHLVQRAWVHKELERIHGSEAFAFEGRVLLAVDVRTERAREISPATVQKIMYTAGMSRFWDLEFLTGSEEGLWAVDAHIVGVPMWLVDSTLPTIGPPGGDGSGLHGLVRVSETLGKRGGRSVEDPTTGAR
ncbi:MAG: hypothetical protein QGG40_10985 [Myxococcota bacterium]|jgi:hypothetical protein|nr:hypothetical protein [Myxococcota bacterium]